MPQRQIHAFKVVFYLGHQSVMMQAGAVSYVMLMVRDASLAGEARSMLKREFGIEAVMGMAFDYEASRAVGFLVTHADSDKTGVYVEDADLHKVLQFLNR